VAVLQGRFMAVNFASDLQAELDYFAGPKGMGVDGLYTDCTRTTSEWLQLTCVFQGLVLGIFPKPQLAHIFWTAHCIL
jgi:hypothetical protein